MHDESRPQASRPRLEHPRLEHPRAEHPRPGRSHLADETRPLASVSDDDLLRRLAEILAQSRRAEAELVAHISEVDERRLYAREAFPSMFAYCTGALHLSEAEAYLRIAAARASREHPMLLAMLGDGRLHLSGIAQLAPHLTAENREWLLRRATHRSKRAIEELIAQLAPREDVPASMRRLPERAAPPASVAPTLFGMGRTVTPGVATLESSGSDSSFIPSPPGAVVPAGRPPADPCAPPLADPCAPSPAGPVPSRPVVQPLAPGRYRVQFTASARLHAKLRRLRDLLRTQVPDGDLAAIIEVAVTEKLERIEARRFATTRRPRTDVPKADLPKADLPKADTSPASRHIPAPVRRAVRERDGGRCRYVDAAGRRCEARDHLEYHHLRPFGLGGDHRPENIRLMCRAHNAYLAEKDYGRAAMRRFERNARATSGSALRPPRPRAPTACP